MTKLEQCVRLIRAMDEAARVEVSQSGAENYFFAVAFDGATGEIDSGRGETPEAAIEELHQNLGEHARLMGEAVTVFEVQGEEEEALESGEGDTHD